MLRHIHFALLTISLVGMCGCQKSKPATLVDTGYDEQEMEAAITRARSEVDKFVAELAKPTGENHAVKAPITDKNGTEYFWIGDLKFENDEFRGTINNDPGIVENVKLGQPWTIKKSEISDWTFLRDGKIHGNYTMRPLLKGMPEAEAAKYRSLLAEP